MKLHLKAKPANEGGRLLARWIMQRHAGDLDRASEKLLVDAGTVQRIVDGEIMPAMLVGACLHRHAGVRARDFNRAALCGWFDDADAASLQEAA